MEAKINAELLKICWAPLGFKLAGQHYAAKFHVEVFFSLDRAVNVSDYLFLLPP